MELKEEAKNALENLGNENEIDEDLFHKLINCAFSSIIKGKISQDVSESLKIFFIFRIFTVCCDNNQSIPRNHPIQGRTVRIGLSILGSSQKKPFYI